MFVVESEPLVQLQLQETISTDMDPGAPVRFQWISVEVYNRLRQWWRDINNLTRGRLPGARAQRTR